MSLVFAAITPHPPLLIPTIGKEAIKKVNKTKKAMADMEADLYLSKPDTIVVISPHMPLLSDAFTINAAPEVETDLREFGDISTRLHYRTDQTLAARIASAAKKASIPLTLFNESRVDHGAAVPLYYLLPHLPQAQILPIGYCALDFKIHLDFGYLIKEEILNDNKRVAVIASGDLSHALNNDAPAGFNPAGAKFDAKIQELLANQNAAGMLQLDKKFIAAAAECGFRSFLILMGVLKDVNYNYKLYSYEGPFGVGYLTANFVL